MKRTAHTRLLVTALVAAAIAAPAANAGTQDSGGHSSGGPGYGLTPATGGGHSSGGPGYGIEPAAGEFSAGGPAFGIVKRVDRTPAAAGRPLPLESLEQVRAADHPLAISAKGGFDWGDAGIGAGAAMGALLMAAAAAALIRNRHKLAHS